MLDLYSVYRVLSSINMLLFVVGFLILMNKRGYYLNLRKDFRSIVTYIVIVATILFIGLPFGMVRFQILAAIIIMLNLICRFIYDLDARNTVIISLIYSFLYILLESSIYWMISMSLKYNAYTICLMDLIISSTIIFIGVFFYNRLNDFYNKNKYKIYISLAIITNALIIVFLNTFSSKIEDFYEILVENNIEYDKMLSTINLSGFIESVFPYILVIINMILIFIFVNYVKSEKENAKMQIVNEKLKMQYKYYLDMEENQKKMRQVYHDMNNHIKNIKSMKNNSSEIDEYIYSIEKEVQENSCVYSTGNTLLDIILFEKNKECIKNEIEFNTLIDFRECDFMDMIDISSIFSNLIDNAIEACAKIDEDQKRYIILRTTSIKGYFVIRCENSKSKNIHSSKDSKGRFITSKKDKFYHGIGIESIKSSINKYGGDIRIKKEEEKFVVSIYLPIYESGYKKGVLKP
ncbi:sensor histidine kinase [Peptoclostridium sp. AF21-18]|uniref:sensor histidine kinase n=1 Tax=Peptoclostridium sp. AF21-18 TaxID=2292243 RepID=UPI000E508D73|nr:sensor histidine kinase [Peptoclostridium sp. AF21-18]RHQ98380.1 ATP-binding protein [Peptoclostridium sp. AF21-18]